MARRSARPKENDDDSGVIGEKDFARAVRIYREDILPAQSKVGEFAQEQSTAFKAIKKQCGIQPQAARTAFRLADLEDAKRDDWMRCFIGLCHELNIPLQSNDLVDMAQSSGQPERPKPVLATLQPSDGNETDLTDAADTDPNAIGTANPFDTPAEDAEAVEPFEAPAEELAKQSGRGAGRKKADLKVIN